MRDPETGTEAVRQALLARSRKGHLSYVARTLNEQGLSVGVAALEAFISGADLAAPTKQALADALFGGRLTYDADNDVLRPAVREEPRTMRPPPPHVPEQRSYPIGQPPAGPQLARAAGWRRD